MSKNTELYYKRAVTLGLDCWVIVDSVSYGFEIHFGKRIYVFRGAGTPFNLGGSIALAKNKYCMNKILENAGFSVPKASGITHEQFERRDHDYEYKHLNYPLVLNQQLILSWEKMQIILIPDYPLNE